MEILEQREYSALEAKQYLIDNNLSSKRFYVNIFGWSVYYTMKPTFATPTGKAKGFPKTITFKRDI